MQYFKLIAVSFLLIVTLVWVIFDPGFTSVVAFLAAVVSIPCVGVPAVKNIRQYQNVNNGDGYQAGGNMHVDKSRRAGKIGGQNDE